MKLVLRISVVVFAVYSSMSFAASRNFELYQQGQIVDSIIVMNQELFKKQFTLRELNRMISRLNSAYETNLGVTTTLYFQVLDKIRQQNASHGMELDPDLVRAQVASVRHGLESPDQLQNLITTTANSSTGVERSVRFLAIKIIAHRMYLSSGNRAALFMTGLAGYYRYNTGNQQLADFVAQCEIRTQDPACQRYLSAARSRLELSNSMQLGH